MRIYKEFHFEMAHNLPLVPPDHKCHRLHGHSYKVILYIDGPIGESGFVRDIDFAEISEAWNEIYAQLDHQYLNHVHGLENPTCENIAVWIWDKIQLNIDAIEVKETATSGCYYDGSEDA